MIIHGYDQRPSKPAEYFYWVRPYDPTLRAVCGRCDFVPNNWILKFKWGELEPSLVTTGLEAPPETLPREDWKYVFDNNNLTRELIFPFVPSVLEVDILRQGPAFRYTRCHWLGPEFGPLISSYPNANDILVTLPFVRWYLFYGKGSDSEYTPAQQFDSDPYITDNRIIELAIREPLIFDSMPTNGWRLVLLHRDVSIDTLGNSRIEYRPYIAYCLESSELEQESVFLSHTTNVFKPFMNPLLLPDHRVHLCPFQP